MARMVEEAPRLIVSFAGEVSFSVDGNRSVSVRSAASADVVGGFEE